MEKPTQTFDQLSPFEKKYGRLWNHWSDLVRESEIGEPLESRFLAEINATSTYAAFKNEDFPAIVDNLFAAWEHEVNEDNQYVSGTPDGEERIKRTRRQLDDLKVKIQGSLQGTH
ncbi:MAG TPA: hypothetical protein VHC20_02790 [Candidatus Paceibacterota bacterium]|nr:hypothetical protein [Candidatus Paceibacterota bacterium]